MFRSRFFNANYWQAKYWGRAGGAPPPSAPPTLDGGGGQLVDESPLWEVPLKYERDDDEEILVLLHG